MKTTFLRAVFALLGIFFCNGQAYGDPLNNWHWRNPLPNGNYQPVPPISVVLNGIVFTNGNFYGVANNGLLEVSPDGTNWTVWATAATNQLNDIICADGEFMAVGNAGTVETSANGTNWVLQDSGTTADLSSVAYGNGKFCAAGGAIIASADGIHWSLSVSGLSSSGQVSGGPAGLVALSSGNQDCFSADGLHWSSPNTFTATKPGFGGETLGVQITTYAAGHFLVGGSLYVSSGSAEAYMFSSTDGQTWQTNDLGNFFTSTEGFSFNFFLSGSSQAVAVGQAEGTTFLMFSPDGLNWSTTNTSHTYLPFPYNSTGAYGNDTYVLAGGDGEYVTANIVSSWTNETSLPAPPTAPPPVGPTSTFSSIAYSNGTYVVASSSSFAVSTNDTVYTTASNSPSLTTVITFGTNFVAVGASGQIYTSTNGFSWAQRNSGTTSNLRSVTVGNNLLVAVGDNGAVQTSSSSLVWSSRSSGSSLTLEGVTYSNGLYVAVGQQGTVITSSDGINWTAQYSGTLNNLLSVTYGWEGFLAVGANGTIITSPDGINWTQQNPGTTVSFTSATFGNGYYLVTSTNATVLTSPDSVNWTARNVGATLGQNLYGSGFLNGRFDVVGASGTILESDPVTLFDVQIEAAPQQEVLTVLAVPGSTFRIQHCTDLANPAWSTAATFNNAVGITHWTNSTIGAARTFYRVVSP
jgi:hypothetical protein